MSAIWVLRERTMAGIAAMLILLASSVIAGSAAPAEHREGVHRRSHDASLISATDAREGSMQGTARETCRWLSRAATSRISPYPGSSTASPDFVIRHANGSGTLAASEPAAFWYSGSGSPCEITPVDTEYRSCRALINANAHAAWRTKATVAVGGIVLGIAAVGASYSRRSPVVCMSLIAVLYLFPFCHARSMAKIHSEWSTAEVCCCIALRARTQGREGPSPVECERTADWYGLCGF